MAEQASDFSNVFGGTPVASPFAQETPAGEDGDRGSGHRRPENGLPTTDQGDQSSSRNQEPVTPPAENSPAPQTPETGGPDTGSPDTGTQNSEPNTPDSGLPTPDSGTQPVEYSVNFGDQEPSKAPEIDPEALAGYLRQVSGNKIQGVEDLQKLLTEETPRPAPTPTFKNDAQKEAWAVISSLEGDNIAEQLAEYQQIQRLDIDNMSDEEALRLAFMNDPAHRGMSVAERQEYFDYKYSEREDDPEQRFNYKRDVYQAKQQLASLQQTYQQKKEAGLSALAQSEPAPQRSPEQEAAWQGQLKMIDLAAAQPKESFGFELTPSVQGMEPVKVNIPYAEGERAEVAQALREGREREMLVNAVLDHSLQGESVNYDKAIDYIIAVRKLPQILASVAGQMSAAVADRELSIERNTNGAQAELHRQNPQAPVLDPWAQMVAKAVGNQ